MPKHKSSRLIGLDVMRALAILLVLFRHAPILPNGTNPILKIILDTLHRGGWVGVDLFFVLSGFLISGLIFREIHRYKTFSIKNFLIRRALRIYPPFYLLIIFTPFLLPLKGLPASTIRLGYLCELLYLQSYCGSFWGHTWSLSIEEHFYLFLPWLLFTILLIRPNHKNPFKSLPYIFIFLAIVCLSGRLLISQKMPLCWFCTLNPTHLRIDSLMAGVVISYFYHIDPEHFLNMIRPYHFWLCFFGILLLFPAFIFPLETTWFIQTIGLTIFYLGSSCLLIGVLDWKSSKSIITKGMVFIGIYSYSIYLWHRAIELWLLPRIENDFIMRLTAYNPFVIYFMGAIILGSVMGFLVEVPILKVRDKLIPTKSGELTSSLEVTKRRRTQLL